MFGSNKKLKIYLSGPMEYSLDGGSTWRDVVEQHLLNNGFDVFNPCKASLSILKKNNLDNVSSFNNLKKTIETNNKDYIKYINVTKQFIKLDLMELRTSDMVLSYLDKTPSGGTAGELTLAKFLDIPVIAFSNDDIASISGWVLGCVSELHYKFSGKSTPMLEALYAIERNRAKLLNIG